MKRKSVLVIPTLAFGGLTTWYIYPTDLPQPQSLTLNQYIQSQGFNHEVHECTTKDGYVLTLHRICKEKCSGPPVLMVHGLNSTSDTWIFNKSSQPIGLQLAEKGWDVWLANTRGSPYSLKHVKLDSEKDEEYWNWTAAEIAGYDVPTFINYVKQTTSKDKLSYIGHSQGGCVMLNMLAVHPDLHESLDIVIALASTGNKFSAKSLFMRFWLSPLMIWYYKLLGKVKVMDMPPPDSLRNLQNFSVSKLFSSPIKTSIINTDIESDTPKYEAKIYGGTSLKNIEYISSLLNNPNALFNLDFGPEKNLEIYGSEESKQPDYKNIKAKVALITGKHDQVVLPEDTQAVASEIPSDKLVFCKLDYPFGHAGILFSRYTKHYSTILDLLETHSSYSLDNSI